MPGPSSGRKRSTADRAVGRVPDSRLRAEPVEHGLVLQYVGGRDQVGEEEACVRPVHHGVGAVAQTGVARDAQWGGIRVGAADPRLRGRPGTPKRPTAAAGFRARLRADRERRPW